MMMMMLLVTNDHEREDIAGHDMLKTATKVKFLNFTPPHIFPSNLPLFLLQEKKQKKEFSL